MPRLVPPEQIALELAAGKDASMAQGSKPPPPLKTPFQKLFGFIDDQRLIIGFALAIFIAFANPKGSKVLYPQVTASYVLVMFIFVMSGLTLKTKELRKAARQFKFNAAVQGFNLGLLTISIWLISKLAVHLGLHQELGDGMTICAALPMTVNMVIVLTVSARGDQAAAIFNSACGNLLGVFVTPGWVLVLLGQSAQINFGATILRLLIKVLFPLAFGQLLQFKFPAVKKFVDTHKPRFKAGQEFCLVIILYTVFCTTFLDGKTMV